METESLAQFWKDILIPENRKNADRKSSLDRLAQQEWVIEYLKKNYRSIFSGKNGAVFSEKDVSDFLYYSRGREITQNFLVRLKFLIKGLEKGKSLYQWEKVIVPTVPIAAPREPSRFTPENFRQLNAIKPLQSSFCACLEKPTSDQPSLAIGNILLSAVLYGGLLDQKWLTPLLRGLPDRVRIHGDIMWVDLQRAYIYPKKAEQPEKAKYVHHRWFPDPLTQSLIIHIHKNNSRHLETCSQLDAVFCLKLVIQNLIPDVFNRPTISELFKGAATWLGLRIPSFLVSYAAGKTTSVSLPPHVWTRLLTDKPVQSHEEVQEDSPSDLPLRRNGVIKSTSFDPYKQEILRKQLASLLGNARRNRTTCVPARESLVTFYEENAYEMVPVLQMLCNWAVELLTRLPEIVNGRKSKAALQPSSVGTYLSAIDKELIACAGHYDISKYDPEGLRDFYFDVVKAVKSKKQKYTAGVNLALFHFYLIRNYEAPNIDMNGIAGKKGPPELGVDANILSPFMFKQVLFELGWCVKRKSRLQTLRCLITILGFRCGLRRSEATGLRIGDLLGEISPEIFVRTNWLNRTKTRDATRRIPSHLLLEWNELDTLMAWKEMRISEEGTNCLDAPLFGTPGNPNPTDANDIFIQINEVLRYITGDHRMRFHHLRHSFDNRLLILLLSNELFNGNKTGPIYKLSEFHLPLHELKSDLFGNMNQGRQFLYGMSSLIGHADPATSLLHYLHLCDWILGQVFRNHTAQPNLTPDVIMRVTGIKRAMLFRSRADSSTTSWVMGSFVDRMVKHVRSNFPDPLSGCVKKLELLPNSLPVKETNKLPDWHLIKHVLMHYQEQGKSAADIAKHLMLDQDEVNRWCTTANAIRGAVTNNGHLRHVTALQLEQIKSKNTQTTFPSSLKPLEERKLVDLIFRKVSTIKEDKINEIRNGISTFINHYNFRQGFLRFKSLDDAKRYRSFLKMIGINDSMISVSMFSAKSIPHSDGIREHHAWLKEIQIDVKQLISVGRQHYKGKHECSIGFVIALKKMRGLQPTKKSMKSPIKETIKTQTSQTIYGFRYAIYMLAIVFGVTPETSFANE